MQEAIYTLDRTHTGDGVERLLGGTLCRVYSPSADLPYAEHSGLAPLTPRAWLERDPYRYLAVCPY